jgi:hypothetical protein
MAMLIAIGFLIYGTGDTCQAGPRQNGQYITRETGSNPRRVPGINNLAAPAHPCATRHRDILTNGHSA